MGMDVISVSQKIPLEITLGGMLVKEVAGEGRKCRVFSVDNPSPDSQKALADHFRGQGWETLGFSTLSGDTSPYVVAYNPEGQNINFGPTIPESLTHRPDYLLLNQTDNNGRQFLFTIIGGREGDMDEVRATLNHLAHGFDLLTSGHMMGTIDKGALAPSQVLGERGTLEFRLHIKLPTQK